MTEFTIGADVSCSDGPCGRVSRLIVEPETETVTHLVVEPKHRGRGRLVPVGLAGAAAGGVNLRCSTAEFDKLDPAEEMDFLPTDSGGQIYNPDLTTPGGGGYAGGRSVSVSLNMANLRLNDGARVTTHDSVPAGEVEVSRGVPVCATDGVIGRIQGLVIDPGSHHVTHVLLEEGHLWGHKEVAIPIGAVTKVGDIVRLTISKQQVQDLPPVDIDHTAP